MRTEINGKKISVWLAPDDVITIGYLPIHVPIVVPKAAPKLPKPNNRPKHYVRHFPRKRWSETDKEELKKLVKRGYSDKEIRKYFNCGKNALYMAKVRFVDGKYVREPAKVEEKGGD
jgi:hypothetical protein